MAQLIRFDWAIKYILRDKANFDILEGFLSELLREKIYIQELLESESNQTTERDKFNRVDLLVKNSQDELIIIEVQNETEYDYFQRMLYATSKAVVEHIQLGQQYAQIKKVIIVSIIYFDLGQGQDYVYHGTTHFMGRHYPHDELKLSDKQRKLFGKARICDLYPEYYAIKVEQFDDVVREQFDEWIYFLKHEAIKPEFQAQGLAQAKEKLDVLRIPPDKRRAYNAYLEDLRYAASRVWNYKMEIQFKIEELQTKARDQGLQQGLQKGIQQGLEQGIQQGLEQGIQQGLEQGAQQKALEIAYQLLDVLDNETISLKTGLSIEQIQLLRQTPTKGK